MHVKNTRFSKSHLEIKLFFQKKSDFLEKILCFFCFARIQFQFEIGQDAFFSDVLPMCSKRSSELNITVFRQKDPPFNFGISKMEFLFEFTYLKWHVP